MAVAGQRVRVIDMHAHCSIPDAVDLMDRNRQPLGGSGTSPATRPTLLLDNLPLRLAAMDEQGIDVEALSINPFWYSVDRDLASEVIRIQNEALADFCARHPERFAGLATVAPQYPDLAAAQLKEAVERYNLRGALVGGSVNGE